jgi:uncharacterized cupredoxin-like copper-binding protein
MMDSGDHAMKMEPVPSSHEVKIEQATGGTGRHPATDLETKSAIYTSGTFHGNDRIATTDDQLSDIPEIPFGESNLVTPEVNIPLKLEPCDDLIKDGDGKIGICDTYPVKCERNPEPGMSGWRTEYIHTTVDQLPAFNKELFGSSFPNVLGTEFSQNTSCALDMKTECFDSGMGDSQGMMTGNSDCAVGQSLVLKSENSDSEVGQSLEMETDNSECVMGQTLEVKTELEESDGTDSMQIKIEPGSVCSLGVKFEENHDTYNTQPVVWKIENGVKTEMSDVTVTVELKKTQGVDSTQVCMSKADPDRVWTKLEGVSMIVMLWFWGRLLL